MGLDYSYVTVLQNTQKQNVLDYLYKSGKIEAIGFGNCALIDFQLDNPILKFIKANIRQTEGLSFKTIFLKRNRFPDYFSTAQTGRIGCVYIRFEESKKTGLLFISFTAATTAMSILFQQSQSVKRWFIGLSIAANAEMTLIDLEEQGCRIIYCEGNEMDVLVPPGNKPGAVSNENILNSYFDLFYSNSDE